LQELAAYFSENFQVQQRSDMRELVIEDMSLVSGGMTENQCIAGFAAVGFLIGAAVGRSFVTGINGAAFGTIVGGLMCNDIIGKDLDGDGY
jgi:hypothetical protein